MSEEGKAGRAAALQMSSLVYAGKSRYTIFLWHYAKGLIFGLQLIEEVFAKEVYAPFVRYCQLHHLREMEDLRGFSPAEAAGWPGVTSALQKRVGLLLSTYWSRHPQAPAPAPKREPLEDRVRAHFEENAHRVIRLSELTPIAGGLGQKELARMLERVDWCGCLDKNSYFYTSPKGEASRSDRLSSV